MGIGPWAAFLLAVASCSFPLLPPAALVAAQDPSSFDLVDFTWTPSPSAADAYELQILLPGTTGWQTVTKAVPKAATGGFLQFNASAPEAEQYTFRMRALRAGNASDWSNEARYLRGVRPASNMKVLQSSGFEVRWTQGSTQAAQIRLERQLLPAGGGTTPWTQLPGVAVADTSYTDNDVALWFDGTQFAYRVIYQKNGIDSAPAAATGGAAPPAAPADLAAAPAGPTAIALTWTPRSRYADRQIVVRELTNAPGIDEVATLSRDASTYTDVVPAPGIYRYRIIARVGPFGHIVNFNAASATVQGFTDLRDGSPLRVSGLRMPSATQAARNAAGAFALAGRVPGPDSSAVLQVFTPQAADWTAHAVSGDEDVLAAGVIYAGDALHVLHGAYLGGPSAATADERFDGQAWQSDGTNVPISAVAADAGGALHAASCSQGPLVYATNKSGSWTHETVFSDDFALHCAIAVGPAGDPRMVYARQRTPDTQNADLLFVTRTAAGWAREQVPLGTDVVSSFSSSQLLRLFAPGATKTILLYQQFTSIVDMPVRAIDRADSGWGTPVAVTEGGAIATVGTAMSADGARISVAYADFLQGTADGTVALRDGAGEWTRASIFHPQHGGTLGFTPAGKLWVLDGLGQPPADRTDYLLFQEP